MVTLYHTDKDIYINLYACVIDVEGYYADYEITPKLFKDAQEAYSNERKAYVIDDYFWETFKARLDEWLNSDGYYRTYDEEKHYEIYTAPAYYEVYDNTGELKNEGFYETLAQIKNYYGRLTLDKFEDYTLVPIIPDEDNFKCKLQKWSGDI